MEQDLKLYLLLQYEDDHQKRYLVIRVSSMHDGYRSLGLYLCTKHHFALEVFTSLSRQLGVWSY